MQIEQVIGGVNGDTSAQAIQLRMRAGSQNFVSDARVVVRDAAGLNPVLVVDMTTDVPVGGTGRRILLTTPSFADYVTTPLVSDFTITNPIPESYLAAGRLTFEDDLGTIYWSLAWGGAGYTGPNNGSVANDANGNYGPPWAGPLPSSTRQALQFLGAANALSVSNSTDYALTPGDAVFVNNANASFQVVSHAGDANGDGLVSGADYTIWADNFDGFAGDAMHSDGDFSHDGFVTGADYTIWADNFGFGEGAAPVPEPGSAALMAAALGALLAWRRLRR
jgi:hypothetical protein